MDHVYGSKVRLLLDTHVWIWSQEQPDEMGVETQRLLLDDANEIWVSSVSTLEIARMVAIGRLILAKELRHWIDDGLRSLVARSLPVDNDIAMESYLIPEPFHKDPADRLLVATTRIVGCTLLTADRLILDYPHVRSADARC